MNARLIIGLVLMLIVVIFIIQNTAVMELRFMFWTLAMSRSLMMFLLLAIGVVIGWFLHGYIAARNKR